MATWASSRAAQDSGGGGGGTRSPKAPATTSTTTPSASRRGSCSRQSMEKWGSTILAARGRFSQIWKSSRGFGPASSRRGNISLWTMPAPAVTHCTSPAPKRAVAPRESEWSMKPRRMKVTVSKPRWGWAGKPGMVSPWYIRQPSRPSKSIPRFRPASDAAGPRSAFPAG